MGRVTITKVAKEAGVSIGTASLVLNNRAKENRLSDECIARVRRAAQDLGYQGNYHARTLLRGKAMTLGFISNYNERDNKRPMIESGFTAEANVHGYEMLSLSAPDGENALRRAARYVEQGRIDGIAVFSGIRPESAVTEDISPAIPIVHVWFSAGRLHPVITVDPAPGIRDAVRHLAELGHRRATWLSLSAFGGPGPGERLTVFKEACAVSGIAATEYILPSDAPLPVRGGGPQTFYAVLHGKLEPLADATAVLCCNDALAIGLCAALRDEGRYVPGDVSVIGFDDVEAFRSIPPLTSVSHRFTEMGRAAVRHLHEMIETGAERGHSVVRIPSELVVRESTAAPHVEE
jgi:LacI family transcriptional regulator